MKHGMNQLFLVYTALTALVLALGSCEAIATDAGGARASETVWIRLIPEPPFQRDDGIWVAKLMLDMSRPIDGLETGLSAAGLANIFTIDYDYSKEIEPVVKMEITSVVKYADSVYVLTVANIPASGGIARVIINRIGFTPSFRLWSLDGHVLPDEDEGPKIIDFRFETGSDNPSLSAAVRGDIVEATGTIVVIAPIGTDPGALKPTVSVNDGSSYTPEGVQDFSHPLTFTVTSAAGISRDYTVTVQVTQSDSASIELFQFRSVDNFEQGWTADAVGSIDGTAISVTAPYGTDCTSLNPTITWMGARIEPDDGARDFSSPVTYTVTAESGVSNDYVVTVEVALSNVASIESFQFRTDDNVERGWASNVSGVIDGTDITVTAPYGTDCSSLKPTIEWTGAGIEPDDGARDFSAPVTYTITAESGVSRDYEVTVEVALSNSASIELFQFISVDNFEQGWAADAVGSIVGTAISVTVPFGTDCTSLKPTIEWTGASIAPEVSAHDFTAPVTYTVTAEDGTTTADYTVTLSEAPYYSISLSESGDYSFPDANFAYTSAPDALTVTVNNTGNRSTGALTIALSGTSEGSFTLSKSGVGAIAGIGINGTETFTVQPKTGLAIGAYEATLTVSGGNNISAGFTVRFTVERHVAQNIILAGYVFNGVARDDDGNSYAVGNQLLNGYIGGFECLAGALIVKFDSDGEVLWAKSTDSGTAVGTGSSVSSVDTFTSVAIDQSGNLYAAGKLYISDANTYAVLIKYDPDDGSVLWTQAVTKITGSGNRTTFAGVATDGLGNAYVVGSQYRGTYQYGDLIVEKPASGYPSTQAVLLKYNSIGIAQWVKTTTNTKPGSAISSNNSFFNSVAVDQNSKDVYVAGDMDGGTEIYGNNVSVTEVFTGYNALLVKYNSNGIAQWAKSAVTAPGDSLFYGVTVDEFGNVYAAGSQYGTTAFDYGCGNVSAGYQGSNGLLVKYNSNGTPLWAKSTTSGGAHSYFRGVAADGIGNVYVAGEIHSGTSYTDIDFGCGNVHHFYIDTAVIVQYSSDGVAQWAKTVASTGVSSSRFYGVAADSSGAFSVVGYQTGMGEYNYGNGKVATGTQPSSSGVIALHK
jgi:hypothetical protein